MNHFKKSNRTRFLKRADYESQKPFFFGLITFRFLFYSLLVPSGSLLGSPLDFHSLREFVDRPQKPFFFGCFVSSFVGSRLSFDSDVLGVLCFGH